MKPKPLVELNHLTVPVFMINPFVELIITTRERVTKSDTNFKKGVRSAHGAKCAISKTLQQNIDFLLLKEI